MSTCRIALRVLLVASLALAVVAATVSSPPAVQRRLRHHRLGTSFKQVWKRTVPGSSLSYNAMDGDPLVLCTDTALSGLNASTGQMLYSTAPVQGSLTGTDEDKVVVSGGTLQAFSRSTGASLWSTAACGVGYSPLVATTRVLVCWNYGQGQTAGLNLTTGATVWASAANYWFRLTPCGPKDAHHRHTLACVPAWIAAMEIDTGKVLWFSPVVNISRAICFASSETSLVAFYSYSWVSFDIVTGKVKRNVTFDHLSVFTPVAQGFGLFCGILASNGAVVCFNEEIDVVLNHTFAQLGYNDYPSSGYDASVSPSIFIVNKNLIITVSASSNVNSTSTCRIDGIELNSTRVVWSMVVPNLFPEWFMGSTVTFFPRALASFFAVTEINGLSLWHARTGAFIARLENELGIVGVFVNEKAPGRIFTVGNTTVASYRLQ